MFISLHGTLKIAIFAGTKAHAREGLEKLFSESENGTISGFSTPNIRALLSGKLVPKLHRQMPRISLY